MRDDENLPIAMHRSLLRRLPLASVHILRLASSQYRLPQPSYVPPFSPSLSPLLQHTYRFSSSSSGSDQELLRILTEEISHEKKQTADSDVESEIVPFSIDDQPGAQEIVLRRSYNNEDIQIYCSFTTQVNAEPPEEEEEEDDDDSDGNDESESAPSQRVDMTVKISKGGDDDPHLEIRCITYGEELVIDHVTYQQATKGEKDLTYEGPQFEDLDSNVQKGFMKFLKARGIDTKFCSFILAYMSHKEQREYLRWLENVKNFIAK